MSILSRHLVRSMAIHALLLAAGMVALLVAMDLMVNFDEFLQASDNPPAGSGRAALLLQAIAGFYGPMSLVMLTIFGGWCVSGGMIFTIIAMLRHGELAVLPASGVSLRRAAVWVVLTGAVIQGGLLAIQELAIPRYLPELVRDQKDIKFGGVILPIDMVRSPEGWLISGKFNASRAAITPFTAIRVGSEGRILSQVNAASGRWNESQHLWILDKGQQRLRPADALPRRQDIQDLPALVCSLDPQTLLALSQFRSRYLLSFQQITRMLDVAGPSLAQHLQQLLHAKAAFPIVNLLTLLFAASWMLHREPGQLARRIGITLLVTPCLWLLTTLLIYAPIEVGTPAMAVWLPLAILAAICATALMRMNT